MFSRLTECGLYKGTSRSICAPRWTSPEAVFFSKYSSRSDVWSYVSGISSLLAPFSERCLGHYAVGDLFSGSTSVRSNLKFRFSKSSSHLVGEHRSSSSSSASIGLRSDLHSSDCSLFDTQRGDETEISRFARTSDDSFSSSKVKTKHLNVDTFVDFDRSIRSFVRRSSSTRSSRERTKSIDEHHRTSNCSTSIDN